MNEFFVPKENATFEIIEKKSRFIASLKYVENEQQARAFVEEISSKYKDARHNCYAYRIHYPFCERCSDDGEPQSTAGMPILDAIKSNEIFNVAIVVTRYFGGILLGKGGLTRAYSRSASDCILKSGKAIFNMALKIKLDYKYSLNDKILKLLNKFTISEIGCTYGENISRELWIKKDEYEKFVLNLNEISALDIQKTVQNESYFAF